MSIIGAILYYAPLKTCLFVTRVNLAWVWLPGVRYVDSRYPISRRADLGQVVFESVVFGLAVSNALQRPRGYDTDITKQFYRDGGMFFTVRSHVCMHPPLMPDC